MNLEAPACAWLAVRLPLNACVMFCLVGFLSKRNRGFLPTSCLALFSVTARPLTVKTKDENGIIILLPV